MAISTEHDRFFISKDEFEPAYMELFRTGELKRRVERAIQSLADCHVCPRDCAVNRLEDKTAACKTGRYAKVASAFPHFGEEDCLRGWNGSGTIFFSMCNLRCVFCFHPATLIPTYQGLRTIADIFERANPTDNDHIRHVSNVRVATRHGDYSPLTKAFRHHFDGELIEIKPFNCPPLLLTPNHQVFVVDNWNINRVLKIRADNLRKDHYLIVPKRIPQNKRVVIDVAKILLSEKSCYKKSLNHRMNAEELEAIFVQNLTSQAIAEITDYHPAYVRKLRGAWKRNWLPSTVEMNIDTLENSVIEEGGLVRFKTEKRPGIPRNIRLDEKLAWLLGLYCAEGYVTSVKSRPNSHRLVFSFGHKEEEKADHTLRLIEALFGIRCSKFLCRTTYTIEANKSSLALFFKKLCGSGATVKKIPSMVYGATTEVIEAFINGLIRGDGYDSDTHFVVNTVSERMALGLFELALFLGTIPSYHRWEPPAKKKIEECEVNQSALHYVKIPKINPKHGKQHSRWTEIKGYFLVPPHKIKRIQYSGPVYNLEVDNPDHSYLAPYVAVSNCQNFDVSQQGIGDIVYPEQLAMLMLRLQAQGCHNINFVTPEHVVPQLLEALVIAIEKGLRLPIVYNTSAYDSMESLALLDGVVDIYMPDFKFWDEDLSLRYLKAKDYPEAARRVIQEMHRQVGDLKFDEHGIAKRGVLVRHLVMPGLHEQSAAILNYLSEISPTMYVNVMDQYYPAGKVNAEKYAEINVHTPRQEYLDAVKLARQAGLRIDERIPRSPRRQFAQV